MPAVWIWVPQTAPLEGYFEKKTGVEAGEEPPCISQKTAHDMKIYKTLGNYTGWTQLAHKIGEDTYILAYQEDILPEGWWMDLDEDKMNYYYIKYEDSSKQVERPISNIKGPILSREYMMKYHSDIMIMADESMEDNILIFGR